MEARVMAAWAEKSRQPRTAAAESTRQRSAGVIGRDVAGYPIPSGVGARLSGVELSLVGELFARSIAPPPLKRWGTLLVRTSLAKNRNMTPKAMPARPISMRGRS